MSLTPGFTRSLATSHVEYLTFANGAGQGFAVGDNISGLSAFEVTGAGNSYQAYFRGGVGIGTPSPAAGYKLDVTGNTKVTGDLNASGTITGGNIQAKYQDVAEWVPSLRTSYPRHRRSPRHNQIQPGHFIHRSLRHSRGRSRLSPARPRYG